MERPRPPGLARGVAAGARVFLRAPTARDRDAFLAATGRSRRLHRPWVAPPRTAAAFAAFLRRSRRPDTRILLVCRREDGALAGVYTVSQIFHGAFKSAYLGYYALVPHAGQRLMREGLDLLLRHAFRRLRLHRLEANIQPENAASIALARGAGFRWEGLSPRYLKIGGRWRDHERWAITVEDRTARTRSSRRRRARRPRTGPIARDRASRDRRPRASPWPSPPMSSRPQEAAAEPPLGGRGAESSPAWIP